MMMPQITKYLSSYKIVLNAGRKQNKYIHLKYHSKDHILKKDRHTKWLPAVCTLISTFLNQRLLRNDFFNEIS